MKAGYVRRMTQFELPWNIYHMRSNGVIVDDIAKDVGGKQSFFVTDDDVACRMPTDEELMALKAIGSRHLSRYDV